MKTKDVRINGVSVQVPADELTDPFRSNPHAYEMCGAREPTWPSGHGGLQCTIEIHDPEVAHIAHGGTSVLAIWSDRLVKPSDQS